MLQTIRLPHGARLTNVYIGSGECCGRIRQMTALRFWARAALASAALLAGVRAGVTQPATPSFDCTKARTTDERAICSDERLSELDQAVSIAYSQVDQKFRQEALDTAKQSLVARRECGADPLCILDNQVNSLGVYSSLGSRVPVPPWVGSYRVKLASAHPERFVEGLPKVVGQCTRTKIASITTRFGDELRRSAQVLDSSGSAVSYANKGYQVSYEFIQALADSRIGDQVLLCLVSIPKNCPPGDNRGRVYSATNLRTGASWILPDAQHMCGGA